MAIVATGQVVRLFPRRVGPAAAFSVLPVLTVAIVTAACGGEQVGGGGTPNLQQQGKFHLEEATIDEIHGAIQTGQMTCKGLVQAYITRAAAYNGICTQLVTKDGTSIPPATGRVIAGRPQQYPTTTLPITSFVPDFDRYTGLPPDFGRMEPTVSDPSVQQQYGMVAAIPNVRQLNALETLNLRGERSVTCKGACDVSPSSGPLPTQCPAVCEQFRQQPDALERAAELDAQYGNKPDLEKLPMYCIPFSFKPVYDAKDMRTTGGADVNYAMDVPPQDATLRARLRVKGAIIYAQAVNDEYNGGSNPGGAAKLEKRFFGGMDPPRTGIRDSWGGGQCNPYDTDRETGSSSSGSSVSVAANLVVCSICESTGGSCRHPADYNGVVSFVTTKGLIPYGGAIGSTPYADRGGIQCRTVKDAARVLDALRDKDGYYFDARDVYTALPKALVSKTPYARYAVDGNASKPLAGMRIGIVREFMVKHTPNDGPLSDAINNEIKHVMRDKLGVEIVESVDPLYPDDPGIPNMAFTFQDALAEVVPYHMPEYFSSRRPDGAVEFAVPGYNVTTRDYLVKAANHKAPWPQNLNLRRFLSDPSGLPGSDVRSYSFSYMLAEYLLRRGDTRVHDLASLNANAKYFADMRRMEMKNAEDKEIDIKSLALTESMKRRDAFRMVVLKVMYENNLDAFVNPTHTIPAAKFGGPAEPTVNGRHKLGFAHGPALGFPEIFVPAGFNQIVYDPEFALNADKTNYDSVSSTKKSTMPHPMPFIIEFWAGAGDEPTLIRIASAYEAATHHRRPPPNFGPLPGEP